MGSSKIKESWRRYEKGICVCGTDSPSCSRREWTHSVSGLTFVCFVIIASVAPTVQSLSTCESWKQLADRMGEFKNHTGFISCEAVNCSGVSCTGYLQENFTLGVNIDPCMAPMGVHVHGSVPSLKTHTSEKPWSAVIYPNESATTYAIPGGKVMIQGVEMDVFLTALVTGYPNATMDIDLQIKACFGGKNAHEDVEPGENCTMAEQILKSGPIKVPPCHLKPAEAEVHVAKPQHPSSVISSDSRGGSAPVAPATSTAKPTSAVSSSLATTTVQPVISTKPSSMSTYERQWSKPCLLKDLYNYFACNVRNHEVCAPLDSDTGEADHGLCVCMVDYVRDPHGTCVLSPVDANGDARSSVPKDDPSSNDDSDEDPSDGPSAPSSSSSSKYSGKTEDGEVTQASSHGGAVAAGILIPLLIVVLVGGGIVAYRRGFCPPKGLQQPLRFSLSRFSSNRSPGMVLIGDGGDDEATA